jgi:transcriptional pleiotropic repressor
MSVQLLDKTRKINKLLHNNHSQRVEFNDICAVLSGILESNILVISKKGKVLGTGFCDGVDRIDELIFDKVGGFVDQMLNERLLSVLSKRMLILQHLDSLKRMYVSFRHCLLLLT